jgi:hypothetical protein
MYEFIKDNTTTAKSLNRAIKITTVSFVANGNQTQFSVGENIGTLFSVSVNGLAQIKESNYNHVQYTTKISFIDAPPLNSVISIQYYKGINSVILDNTGKLIQFIKEEFVYTGTTSFNLKQSINSLMTVETNGLAEEEGVGFDISTDKQITYLYNPVLGSKISISYLY